MVFSIILTDNNRSKSYLQNLILHGFIPIKALYIEPQQALIEQRSEEESKVGLEQYNCFFTYCMWHLPPQHQG